MGNVTEKDWTEIYTQLFKPAIEGARLRYNCTRSQIRNGAFTKDIVQNLFTAHVVLADITFYNPNVMWELGVRHALAKRTILVARKDVMSTKIISDLSTYGVIPYDPTNLTKATQFKRDIKDVLKKIDTDPNRSDNPVFDFLKQEQLIQIKFEHQKNIKKLSALLTECIENYRIVEQMLDGTIKITLVSVPRNRFTDDALNMLVTTNYINMKIGFLKKVDHIRSTILWVNRELDAMFDQFSFGEGATQKQIDFIKKDLKKLASDLKIIIKEISNELNELQKNKQEDNPPPMWMWDSNHKKLL